MMELMPNSGVFVYPKDTRVSESRKKESGTAMARYLMSVFYTNEELVLRGNLMGTNGKDGLNRQIVNTCKFIHEICLFALFRTSG